MLPELPIMLNVNMAMEEENYCVSLYEESSGTRKQKVNGRKCDINKGNRYRDPDPLMTEFERPCKHRGDNFFCAKVTLADIIKCRAKVYASNSKNEQDGYIASHLISTKKPLRNRSRSADFENKKPHAFHVTYQIPLCKNDSLTVCKSFFIAALGIKKRRLHTICKTHASNKVPTDKRGGDRKSVKSHNKKQKVREFIKKLKGQESHYNRLKSKRIYLDCDLNISKLTNMYNNSINIESPQLKVSQSMFRRIFVSEFNIGFRSPTTDVCSSKT